MERIKLYGTQWSTHEDIWPNVTKFTLPKYTSRKPTKKKIIIVNCIDVCTTWLLNINWDLLSQFTFYYVYILISGHTTTKTAEHS